MIRLVGLACPVNAWTYHKAERLQSCVTPGAFAPAIAGGLIRLNVAHRQDHTLAAQDTGNLRVWEEETGLMFDANLEPSPLAKFIAHGIAIGLVQHLCIAVAADGVDLPSENGRRVAQTRVHGLDIAVLVFTPPHFSGTWIKVL
jgi:phage head maturation protease